MNSGRITASALIVMVITNAAVAATGDSLANTSQTPSVKTPVSRTIELQTLAKHWGLDKGEYQHYLDLIRGPLGKWSPSIDPLLALGMFAKTPQQEQRYAELYARQEFDLTERALQFQQAYRTAFERLYPNVGVVDHQLLSPYFMHKQQKATMRETKRLAKNRFVEGDRLLLFVPATCRQCLSVINQLVNLLSGTQQSGVDVYIRDALDDEAVRAWATGHGIKAASLNGQQLSLNRDEGLLQRLMSQSSGLSSVAMPLFLKRNGRFFQLNKESLGL